MSATNTSTFTNEIKQVTIWIGLPILTAGIIGDILNCIVFLSLKTFRENTCAFYLITLSFVNIGQLLTSFLPRITSIGFDITVGSSSDWFCKARVFVLQFCTIMSYTCMCLATIDQFLSTCFNPRWQQLSTIKISRALSLIFFFVWMLHGIPFLMFLNIVQSPITGIPNCVFTNHVLSQYFIYGVIITLAYFVPVTITILFGFLAYRNVTQLAYRTVPLVRREVDKQLSTMVFIQVIFNCFATTPYIVVYILQRFPRLTSQPFVNAQLSLAASVLILMYYMYYASPFYIYICVSERFRCQLMYVLIDIHLNRWRRRMLPANQVSP